MGREQGLLEKLTIARPIIVYKEADDGHARMSR